MAAVLPLIAFILVIIGAINWGLIGTLEVDLVKTINKATFDSTMFERIIFTVVGIAALVLLYYVFQQWPAIKALYP